MGYGLRDEHVRRLLAKIRARRGVWTKRAYAVGFYDTVCTKVLDLRKIQAINETADDVLPQLATAVGYQSPGPSGKSRANSRQKLTRPAAKAPRELLSMTGGALAAFSFVQLLAV